MQPSEKEIERILRSVPSIGPYHAGAGEAARLIAEKLGRVVWSDQFKAEVEERPGYEFDYVVLRKDDSVVMSLMHKGIKDGQKYTVTVTKEE